MPRLMIIVLLFAGFVVLSACEGGDEKGGSNDAAGKTDEGAATGGITESGDAEGAGDRDKLEPADNSTAVLRDMTTAFKEIPVALEGVDSVPSANMAAETLNGIKTRLEGMLDIYNFLGLADEAQRDGLDPELSAALEEVEQSINQQMERMGKDHPEAMPVILESIRQFGDVIDQLEGDPQ